MLDAITRHLNINIELDARADSNLSAGGRFVSSRVEPEILAAATFFGSLVKTR